MWCSRPLRSRKSASISSMKTMHGLILRASEKMARVSWFVSPTQLLIIVDGLRLMNAAPLSFATALASDVFPVPGGPYRRMPLGGPMRLPIPLPRRKSSGCWMGYSTSSRSCSLISSSPPIDSKPPERSLGKVISDSRVFSCEERSVSRAGRMPDSCSRAITPSTCSGGPCFSRPSRCLNGSATSSIADGILPRSLVARMMLRFEMTSWVESARTASTFVRTASVNGIDSALRHSSFKSLPLYPVVRVAIAS
mmetsp:Transcript_12816/g.32459  ORF Transcript_12816/g.32459 Transcript_12816/m.32459 type:complete len:252 (+) Transcript_12816:629-1384(+)